MRSCLALLLFALGLPALGATRTLLLLEDQTAVGLCGRIYRDWLAETTAAGWRIRTVPVARWDRNWASNHWVSLGRMSNAVAEAQPDAVLIFGSLPYLQTAVHAIDGHEYRRIHTDAWLGCTNLLFTDSVLHFTEGTVGGLPSVVGTNAPGDGFPDQAGAPFSIPVSRIDAAGLSAFGGAGSTFASGYLAGVQILQASDEGDGLRRYLTNVVAYRRREFAFAEAGRIEGAWLNPATITGLNSAVTWTTGAGASSFAGLTNRWAYVGSEWGLASPNYITSGGTAALSCGHVTYKSYHMEEADGSSRMRRPLFPGWWPRPLALVTMWGYGAFGVNPYWAGQAPDETVADVIRSSVVQASGTNTPTALFYLHWINGDLTLPVDPITAAPLGRTSGTTLRILTP